MSSMRNNALDARTWNETPGTSHLVQNNYGGSLGGPLLGKQTFFFLNFEGFRQAQAQTAMDTGADCTEAGGDFSASGATVFRPIHFPCESQLQPRVAGEHQQSQTLRSEFPNNVNPGRTT